MAGGSGCSAARREGIRSVPGSAALSGMEALVDAGSPLRQPAGRLGRARLRQHEVPVLQVTRPEGLGHHEGGTEVVQVLHHEQALDGLPELGPRAVQSHISV
jgi:hypothetical protein